jgi:polyisoprenoid-binding protein YceI
MTTPAQQDTSTLQAQLASGALAGDWTLDPSSSTVTLRSKSMWGLAPVKGVFRDVTGSGTITASGEVTGRIDVAAESVDTKNPRRDKHLRSADFFLSDKHPLITFTLDKLTVTGDGATVAGTLTARETGKPLSFPASATLTGDGEIVLDASVEVDRAEFGMTWSPLGLASVKNTIAIHAVFARS